MGKLIKSTMLDNQNNKIISLFIPTLDGGGAQRVVVNLVNSLVDITDHPIHVVLVKKQGSFLELIRSEVEVIDLGAKRTFFSLFKLTAYLKKNRPAVIMSSLNYANIICTLAHKLAYHPCRLVLREANVVRVPEGKLKNRVRMHVTQMLMRYSYLKADAIVVNSYDTMQTLISAKIATDDKICMIANPMKSIDKLSISDNKIIIPVSNDYPFICSIGRLSEQKGFDILLEAFSRVSNQKLNLVILGEGELREDLTRQAKELGILDRVHMPGFINSSIAILSHAKAFVLSSRWEGMPNVLIEALAIGAPIVATNCPGAVRDVLQDGALGHLVAYDDPQALADGIERTLTEPAGTPESRKQRAADFSAEKIAKAYLEKVLLPSESSNKQDAFENINGS